MPLCLYTPIHLYAPYICMPPGVYTPICSPYFSVQLYVPRASACCGGLKGPPYMWDTSLTPPLYGVSPLQLHPHKVVDLPVDQ